jgi:hypothetical protein
MLVGRTRKIWALVTALALGNLVLGLTLAGDLRADSPKSAMNCPIKGCTCNYTFHLCTGEGLSQHPCTNASDCFTP